MTVLIRRLLSIWLLRLAVGLLPDGASKLDLAERLSAYCANESWRADIESRAMKARRTA